MAADRALLRILAAELVGTFALVFAGCGAIMVDAKTHALGHVGVAFSFGLVIMAMVYAVGHISRHFPWPRALAYWGAQLLGALIAAALLRGSLGNIGEVGATLSSGSQAQFLWELVLSFFLMFVIMAVATRHPRRRRGGRDRLSADPRRANNRWPSDCARIRVRERAEARAGRGVRARTRMRRGSPRALLPCSNYRASTGCAVRASSARSRAAEEVLHLWQPEP